MRTMVWTLSTMTSQHKNKNGGDSRRTLYRVVSERWGLAMIMFIYYSNGEGEVYILT